MTHTELGTATQEYVPTFVISIMICFSCVFGCAHVCSCIIVSMHVFYSSEILSSLFKLFKMSMK